jgi:hypothetical protein
MNNLDTWLKCKLREIENNINSDTIYTVDRGGQPYLVETARTSIINILKEVYEAGRTDEQEESDNPPDPERN